MPKIRREKDKSHRYNPKNARITFNAPGHHYMGPFNPLDNGPITNEGDAISFLHDVDATEDIAERGKRPFYLTYNSADERFLQRLKKIKLNPANALAIAYYESKKRLAKNDLSYIKEIPWSQLYKKQRLGISEVDFDRQLATTPELRPALRRVIQHQSDKKNSKERLHSSIRKEHHKARKRLFDSNRSIVPQLAAPPAVAMTEPGSGNDRGLKETPIDDVWNVQRGPPKYQFATLPFMYDTRYDGTFTMRQAAFRMTSPYNVLVATSNSDVNAGAGSSSKSAYVADSGDATAQKARWYDYYSAQYKYYHVVGCRWHLTVENYGNNPFWIHQLYYNDVEPPITADNNDILLWDEVNSYYVGTHAVAVLSSGKLEENQTNSNDTNMDTSNNPTNATANFETGNNIQSRSRGPVVQMSGQYQTGDVKRDIRLDSEVENWTAVAANPALPERLLFRFQTQNNQQETNSANSTDQIFSFRFFIRLEYLVEFKELKDELKWPTIKQPISITVDSNTARDPDTNEG